MFTYDNKQQGGVPIKIWLNDLSQLDEGCLAQAQQVASLPFVYRWFVLMPDTHIGAGMPIGGVLAARDVIVPYAVGMDIGCGMSYIQTDIPYDDIKLLKAGNGYFLDETVARVLEEIPVGTSKYRRKQHSAVLDRLADYDIDVTSLPDADKILDNAYYQVGTLGGGNHFIEFQADDDGNIGIMLHSGSRHLGARICQHFNRLAADLNTLWYSRLPENSQLSFLPVETSEGKTYIRWMTLALDYAAENRARMLEKVMAVFSQMIETYLHRSVTYSDSITCHHNYAALEEHYGEKVWVHRKGATKADAGDLGIIPGAMGSSSYLVMGLGNPESFHSSSHGAGRIHSRTQAKALFPVKDVLKDLKQRDVSLAKRGMADVAEESRFAYKDIDEVMAHQQDLVRPLKRLRTVGVVKG